MSKINIADNGAYTIDVAADKNRAYLKIKGFWRNAEAVPEYLNDWRKALEHLDQGFTLVTDASEMITHPQEVKELHKQAQLLLKDKNVAKVAEIIANDLAEIQLNGLAKTTDFPKQNFRDLAAAEKWLDEQ